MFVLKMDFKSHQTPSSTMSIKTTSNKQNNQENKTIYKNSHLKPSVKMYIKTQSNRPK